MISRRAFLQTFLPIVFGCMASPNGTIPSEESPVITLGQFNNSCIEALPNGAVGKTLIIDSNGNPAWSTANDLAVTPPTGFSSTELGDLLTEMASSIGVARQPNLIIADGNSLTDERPFVTPWPRQVIELTGAKVVDVAVSGMDITHAAARAPENIDNLVGLAIQTTVIIWEGTNYLIQVNGDVNAAYLQHVVYCRQRKAAGVTKIYIGTIISRNATATYTFAQREQFNSLLRANWATFADGLLDFAADIPQLGGNTSYQDTTYFSDGVHLTDAGSRLIADYVIGKLGL